MAEALYRKYRPQVFEDVVGQEPIERTLKNAISQDKVSHAYLFCGPRGTGKTTTARLLAKALLCECGPTPDPDGTCEDCLLIADGAHPDVYELDAASRTGVENVREEIISRVSFAPTRGRYKVYIIDEVHMLSTAAFNALLKTLEEPPSHVVFVLCTTDPQKVPETIHSRCQRFDFHRISPESMVARLGAICMAEEVDFEGEALDLIAQRADGGLRNALTSLEQIIAFENGKVTLAGAERLLGSIDSNDMAEIVAYIGKRDIASCFRWTAAYVETGADLAQFVRDMSEHVRNLYVMALAGDDAALDVSETARRELANELVWFGADRAARLLGVLGDLSADLKTTSNPRLAFEIALTRMVRPDSDLTLESLAERIEALESGYSAVSHVLPGQPHEAPAAVAADPLEGVHAASVAPAQAQAPQGAAPIRAVEYAPAQEQRREPSSPAAGGTDDINRSSRAGAHQPAVDREPAQGANDAGGHSSDRRADANAATGGGLPALANPAALQRIWQAALADVKKRKQAYGVLFMNTKAHYDEGNGMVRVVFPAESTFAFNAVQKPDVQEALEEALAKAAGGVVGFCFEKGTGQGASSSRSVAGGVSAPSTLSAASTAAAASASSVAAPVPAASGAKTVNRNSEGERVQVDDHSQLASQPVHADARHAQDAATQMSNQQAGRGAESRQEQSFAPSGQPSGADSPSDVASYESGPYDQVPYDDAYYDYVPYDEFDAPSDGGASAMAPESTQDQREPQSYSDADTAPSPAGATLTPDGAVQEDAAALQAMLQASFGGGVVFSEADD